VSRTTEQAKHRNAHLVSRTPEQVKYINVHLVSRITEQVKYRYLYLVYLIDIVIVDIYYNELYELHEVDLLVKMKG
jgi:hypothetical protein